MRNADPRFDPTLRPDQWRDAAQRSRRLQLLSGVVALTLLGILLVYFLWPIDRTQGLYPEEIAHAAGQAILRSDRFSLKAFLDGEIPQQSFPTAAVAVQFQREPLLLHVVGAAGLDDNRIPLEYYLEGADLVVKDPGASTWRVIHQPNLGELQSYQPQTLAVPLTTGLQRATVLGRDQVVGGEAVILKLDLYDDVMPMDVGQGAGKLDYTVWIYTRTLKPARMVMDYKRVGEPAMRQVTSFSYALTFEFPSLRGFAQVTPLVVPDHVRAMTIRE